MSELTLDLTEILDRAAEDLRELDGARVFVTGGTGFFGRWLLETLAAAIPRFQLRTEIVVLSRNPEAFAVMAPAIASHSAFTFVRGDVVTPPTYLGRFDACIHAATPASLALVESDPKVMLDTIVRGTASVLELLAPSGSIPLLLVSSGAIYGPQPATLALIPEAFGGGPNPLDPTAVYAEGKRVAELMCALLGEHEPSPRIARCFAFYGPYLPIDTHFAVGNFTRDALRGGPIVITGDGATVRSYLYPTDLVVWLLRILVGGRRGRAYNVGSELPIALGDAAYMIASQAGGVEVQIMQRRDDSTLPPRYVPSTERIRKDLGVEQVVGFDEAIARTLRWHREIGGTPLQGG